MKTTNITAAIEKLEEIIDLSNDEYGEALQKLVELYRSKSFYFDKFNEAVGKEIFNQVKHFEKNYKIVTEEEHIPVKSIRVKKIVEK